MPHSQITGKRKTIKTMEMNSFAIKTKQSNYIVLRFYFEIKENLTTWQLALSATAVFESEDNGAASGCDKTPCLKIDKPLDVYIMSNFMQWQL